MTTESLPGLSAFVRAVEAGSFTGAAKLLGTTPSAISKSIARLEARVGARLIHRSTRAFELTDEGKAYHERIAPLVRGLEEANEVFSTPSAAIGSLRVSMPTDIGRMLLPALISKLMARHPRLQLDISLSDQHVDLVREGFDVALRAGHVDSAGLYARPIAEVPLALVAAPDYLARHGTPRQPADLTQHRHIVYRLAGKTTPILFADGPVMPPAGIFASDSGEAMRIAAVHGAGIAQMMRPAVQAELDADRLRVVLPDVPLQPIPLQALHAFGRRIPNRARVLMEFVIAEIGRQRP
ncbi:MAG: LysR family transcriptional regulator [Cupriavidus sp.]|nr:MAG: LysR family transcriptional regulator [Cupriavidus sp.]